MAGYRLPKQKEGTHVSYWPDPRGPGHGSLSRGTILNHVGDSISIAWFEGPDMGMDERWTSQDLRYRVDRGQVILTPPPKQRRLRVPKDQLACKLCGTLRKIGCDCPRMGALKPEEWGHVVDRKGLTRDARDDTMVISNEGNTPSTQKGHMMAKAKGVTVVEEVDDELEELDEPIEVASSDGDGGSNLLSAKAAASALGTDGRTLRKFLRKKHGTIGQGQRWEIDPADLDQLKIEFAAFGKGGAKGEGKKKSKKDKPPADDVEPVEELDADELEEIEDISDLDLDDELELDD